MMFMDLFDDCTSQCVKVKTDEYGCEGKYVIVDQGQGDIAGYTNRESGVYRNVPAIVFGDHTRIVKYIDKPLFLGADGVKLLKCKRSDANYKYLFYALKNAKIPNTGYNRHFKWLKEIYIEYPNIDVQNRIVRTLDKINNVIENRKKQITQLDTLIKARFVEMFGDMQINTKGWKTFSFSDVFDITSSKRILKSEWTTKGIPFLRVRDMVQLATEGTLNNEFWVSEEFYSLLSDADGRVKEGDILMSATSTLGKCHIVTKGEQFYYKDADVLRFRPKDEIEPTYFVKFMETEYIKEQIVRTLGITTVSHFTISAAKKIFVRLPPISLQTQFADFVAQVDKSKVAIQKSLEETQLLFDSLMQKYFG